jgi:hypothetical protein
LNPKPSWFGESVGRYESGQLVIDTIGFAEHPFSFVDNWRTPHTKDLHMVERWKIIDGGNAIEATVTFDDPGAFNAPWSGLVRWSKLNRQIVESVCAETTRITGNSSVFPNIRCRRRKHRTSDRSHLSSLSRRILPRRCGAVLRFVDMTIPLRCCTAVKVGSWHYPESARLVANGSYYQKRRTLATSPRPRRAVDARESGLWQPARQAAGPPMGLRAIRANGHPDRRPNEFGLAARSGTKPRRVAEVVTCCSRGASGSA